MDEEVSNDGLKQESPSLQKERSFNLLADVVVAFCGDGLVVSEEVLSGRCPVSCKEDMNILYNIKHTYIGSPFAYLNHNRYQMYGEECPFATSRNAVRGNGAIRCGVCVFARVGEDIEVLYQDNHCDGSRIRFMSLVPGNELYDDVLNMVVGMCNGSGDGKRMWWLPTTFSQMILDPRQYNQPTMDYIKDRYMGKADDITRIYIPLHVLGHWYLMIIDMWDRKLVYLDSLKSLDINVTALRISRMKEVNDSNAIRPCIEDFEPDYPVTGQQGEGTLQAFGAVENKFEDCRNTIFGLWGLIVVLFQLKLGCRVWVCQWMINCHLWRDYALEEVNDNTRMSLVVDLVTSPHNPVVEIISDRSVNYWNAEMLRHFKAQHHHEGKGKSPAKSSNITI
ncbi:hypothetical protein PIB30_009926 [Stylosanthes scabra]|uniref:Ubiquitin-like protease family profile domain-containing protein n=1 Tax=Stylosanthes scabra TaxID=79078 RepID=A0ABU6S5F7_9FABA|nr:hypothetical protein [Stylosanthes scabra]